MPHNRTLEWCQNIKMKLTTSFDESMLNHILLHAFYFKIIFSAISLLKWWIFRNCNLTILLNLQNILLKHEIHQTNLGVKYKIQFYVINLINFKISPRSYCLEIIYFIKWQCAYKNFISITYYITNFITYNLQSQPLNYYYHYHYYHYHYYYYLECWIIIDHWLLLY